MSKVDKRRSEILDECLSQIQSGASSLSDCLEAHPEYAEFLKIHLTLAVQTRDLLVPSTPSQDFVTQTKTRLLNRIRATLPISQESRTKRALRPSWLSRPAMAYITLMMVIGLLASGLGVAGASASALPGDPLYGVKLRIEETRLALTQDPSSDAELLLLFADTRLEEAIALADALREEDIDLALVGYEDLIGQLLDLAGEGEFDNQAETLNKVHFGLEHHQAVLEDLLQRSPEEVSSSTMRGLQNALNKSIHGKSVIDYIESGGNPSDLAPGQQDKEKDETEEKENQGNPPSDRGGGSDGERTPGRPPTKTPKPEKE